MSVDFNQSAIDPNYNGNTCSNFCCRRAEATGPSSWTFPFNPSHPACTGNNHFPCTRWVPCDVSNRLTPGIIALALSAPFLLYLAFTLIYRQRIRTRIDAAFTIIVQLLFFWMSLIAFYDQQNWASQTEADKVAASTYGDTDPTGKENGWEWWQSIVVYSVARSSILYAIIFFLSIMDICTAPDDDFYPFNPVFVTFYFIFMLLDLIVPSIYTPSNKTLLTYGNAGHWFEINGTILCYVSGAFWFITFFFDIFMSYMNSNIKPSQTNSTFQSSSFTDNNDMLQRVRLLPA